MWNCLELVAGTYITDYSRERRLTIVAESVCARGIRLLNSHRRRVGRREAQKPTGYDNRGDWKYDCPEPKNLAPPVNISYQLSPKSRE